MTGLQRYTWEDALIEAEVKGILPAGAVNMCLRLARAINWAPKDGGPSELRWKNVDALNSVGSSRGTYKRYRPILIKTGFLTQKGSNLVPLVPDLNNLESHIETLGVSHCDSEGLTLRPGESHFGPPYSEDTYSDNPLSEDLYSEELAAPVSATASPDSANAIKENEMTEQKHIEDSTNVETVRFLDGSTYVLSDSGVTRESQIETPEVATPVFDTDSPIGPSDDEDHPCYYNGKLYYSVNAVARVKQANAEVSEDW